MIETSPAVTAIFDGVAARVYASTSRVRSLAITSTLHGEGSTTVALGLVLSLAAYEESAVLLIDGNWIRPALTEAAGRNTDPGLTECLRGETRLAEAIAPTARRGLLFLPVGEFGVEPPPFGRLAAILEQAHQRFGKVVVDLPPVLVAPAVVVAWASAVDQSYFVLRRAVTPVALIRRALSEVGAARPPQLILNRTRDGARDFGVLGLV
jgi:Mrp family chromosome partitioning ATPase